MADPAPGSDAHTKAVTSGWFAIIIEAVERSDDKLGTYLGALPDNFRPAVMSLTKDYSGLALTALQRATLSGNLKAGKLLQIRLMDCCTALAGGPYPVCVAVKMLKEADSQLLGVQLPVSLRGVDPSSWRSELPSSCPAALSDVLRLCPELDWLHLAVLSGHGATARLVHGLTANSSDSRSNIITPALLSMFAHPVLAERQPGDCEFPEAIYIAGIVLGESCTPDFVRDVWLLGVAFASPAHLQELVWHLINLVDTRTPTRPFQMQTHLSILPAMLPSLSFKGVVVSAVQPSHMCIADSASMCARLHWQMTSRGTDIPSLRRLASPRYG